MESAPRIPSQVATCGKYFHGLIQALPNAPHFAAQVKSTTVIDEFDRFKGWAGNIAAHRKGRRSLEYRLRDAPHLKAETCNLLGALQDDLENALAIVTGERLPLDESAESDSESETDEEDISASGDTELEMLLSSVENTITCLFRLSIAIRDPAPESQFRSMITVDKSHFHKHDIQHVEEKFKSAEGYLINRLGIAISGRRSYLSYREEHHEKLAKRVEVIGIEEPRTEHTTNSTEATPLPAAPNVANKAVIDEGEDTQSQTSYAQTDKNSTLRVPRLPKEASKQEHFECPLCFMIVSIHTHPVWKQHVYRDLHPYCCTFEACTTAERLYDSRHAWFKHELEAHRAIWQCVEGCERTFDTEKEFVDHVAKRHSELASDNILSVLKRTAVKSATLTTKSKCPLCDKTMSLRMLQKHLGNHQEELALFALPSNIDATEDEELESDVSQNNEELSDISEDEMLGDEDEPNKSEVPEPTSPVDIDSLPIKCVCGISEDDGDLVLCEMCNSWQHIFCYYSSTADVPDVHPCVDCHPRRINWRSHASATVLDLATKETEQTPEDHGGPLDEPALREENSVQNPAVAYVAASEPWLQIPAPQPVPVFAEPPRSPPVVPSHLSNNAEHIMLRKDEAEAKQAEDARSARLEQLLVEQQEARFEKERLKRAKTEALLTQDDIEAKETEGTKYSQIEQLGAEQQQGRMEKEQEKRTVVDGSLENNEFTAEQALDPRFSKLEQLLIEQQEASLRKARLKREQAEALLTKDEIEAREAEGSRYSRVEQLLVEQQQARIRKQKEERISVDLSLLDDDTKAKRAEDLRFAKLEELLLEQQQARIIREEEKKIAAEEAARKAAEWKKKGDEDKLAKLEQLILAQKEEQLKREAAAEALPAAEKAEAEAKAAKYAAEKIVLEEAAAKLLEAAKQAPAASPMASAASDSSAVSVAYFSGVPVCNRCRLRKTRCDRRLPSCASCAKANVKCVGYDSITKREIPRSDTIYLTREHERRAAEVAAREDGDDLEAELAKLEQELATEKAKAESQIAEDAAEKKAAREAAAKLLEAAKQARAEAERKAAEEADEATRAHGEALVEAIAAGEKLAKVLEEVNEPERLEAAKRSLEVTKNQAVEYERSTGRSLRTLGPSDSLSNEANAESSDVVPGEESYDADVQKAAAEEEVKLKSNPEDAQPCIKFKDAVGRKFIFPWHICNTWKGMEALINEAFKYVDIIGPHVHEGHYNLLGPDGGFIHPQHWESIVKPDWTITMHMWNMAEPAPEPPKYASFPPPPPPPPLDSDMPLIDLLEEKGKGKKKSSPN